MIYLVATLCLAVGVSILTAFFYGKKAEQNDSLEKTGDIQKKQLDISVLPADDADTILKRMRDGGL